MHMRTLLLLLLLIVVVAWWKGVAAEKDPPRVNCLRCVDGQYEDYRYLIQNKARGQIMGIQQNLKHLSCATGAYELIKCSHSCMALSIFEITAENTYRYKAAMFDCSDGLLYSSPASPGVDYSRFLGDVAFNDSVQGHQLRYYFTSEPMSLEDFQLMKNGGLEKGKDDETNLFYGILTVALALLLIGCFYQKKKKTAKEEQPKNDIEIELQPVEQDVPQVIDELMEAIDKRRIEKLSRECEVEDQKLNIASEQVPEKKALLPAHIIRQSTNVLEPLTISIEDESIAAHPHCSSSLLHQFDLRQVEGTEVVV